MKTGDVMTNPTRSCEFRDLKNMHAQFVPWSFVFGGSWRRLGIIGTNNAISFIALMMICSDVTENR